MEVARTLGADFRKVEGLNQRVCLRAEFSDPGDEIRKKLVEGGFKHRAVLLEILHGIPDRAEAMVPQGDPVKHAIETLVGAVVAEPVILDPGLKGSTEFRRQDSVMLPQGTIALIDEGPEGQGTELRPAPGQEVIMDDITDHPGKAPPRRSDRRPQPGGDPVGIGEAIDRPVADDSVENRLRKPAMQGFRPAGHEVAEKAAHAGAGIVFGEEEVGQVVQARANGAWEAAGRNGGFAPGAERVQIWRVSWIWCNGEYLDGPLTVSGRDRGLTHGLGVFETLLAIDGRPEVLEMHLERMRAGAERLGWSGQDLGTVRIAEAITGLLKRLALDVGRARVRIALSAGEGDLADLRQGWNSLVWIIAAPAPPPPESVVLATASFPRNETSPLAGIKCASYAENLIALDQARRNGADELLFYNTKGELCEGTTSNVFLVMQGKVFTPPLSSGCLPGTMRARVIAKCRELGIPVFEVILTAAHVGAADEAFLTSSTRGVVPVRAIDRQDFPAVSEVMQTLADAMK